MALTRQQKSDLIDSYRDGLANAPHAFLVDYKGISVPDVTELRAKIREVGGQYVVVKNTLALLAIADGPMDQLRDLFEGPVAVAYHEDDAVSLAKALDESSKAMPAIEVTGGLVNGQKVDADQLKEIASLPTREDLIAKLLFLLQSPVTRLARVLAAVPREFVVVLDQIRQQKEQG